MLSFSIIVPAYNAERYLAQCLDSLLSQDYPALEVIAVDDGSTDGTAALLDSRAAADGRLKVIRQPNAGPSAARNTGMRHATGDYVLFLDSDDYWCGPDRLTKIAERLEQEHADVLSYNDQKEADGKIIPTLPPGQGTMPSGLADNDTVLYLLHGNRWHASPCNKAIRRSLLADHALYFRENCLLGEDIDWCLQLLLASGRVDYISDIIFTYRKNHHSRSTVLSADKVRSLAETVRLCRDMLENTPIHPSLLPAMRGYIGYEVAIVLLCIAHLDTRTAQQELLTEIIPLLPFLRDSSSRKVKLIRAAITFVGIRNTVRLLHHISL